MSRIAKSSIVIPDGVDVHLGTDDSVISVKGQHGSLSLQLNRHVLVSNQEGKLTFSVIRDDKESWAFAGTMRALINNMIQGVSRGFEKRLQLVGVGYRVQIQGDTLNLSLGFSHPILYKLPSGVSASTPSQTEIVITGIDKHLVGQVASEIRRFRPPEPYKGKGVRYADELVVIKETKKK